VSQTETETKTGFTVARLDEIERSGARSEWIPIRRHLGIQAFGVNAWAGDTGAKLIGEHDETPTGHEELYIVIEGRATFTVAGDEIDGPAGTIVFVRDPATQRGAVAAEDGTTILTAGGKPGEAFRVQPWEINSEVFPLFDRGEHAEAKRMLEEALVENPEAAGLLYNLACAEAQLGELDAAIRHLTRSIELSNAYREFAQTDSDLEPIRDDPRFPAA
jgi:tetratricopeptide (TPR) repeat protein